MASDGVKSRSIKLLRGPEITLTQALTMKTDVLNELTFSDRADQHVTYMETHQGTIKHLVAHHLGLSSPEFCTIAPREQWMYGTFNMCIRIDIAGSHRHAAYSVIFRCPLPYKIGEDTLSGNADEKTRCEAATYAWLQEHCPSVRIPHLYGFGLTNGTSFTHIRHRDIVTRGGESTRRRLLKLFGRPVPSYYTPHRHRFIHGKLQCPYLLIEFIGQDRGQLLSRTWWEQCSDAGLREHVFRGFSRIILALTRIPLPKIGSFTIDDRGFLSLSNRPLTLDIARLENDLAIREQSRESTYDDVRSYMSYLQSVQSSRLHLQANAIESMNDGYAQAAAQVLMKSTWERSFDPALANGPFFMTLTDFNRSNTFVDKDWNITCLVDLEWACTRPAEMIHPPYWLTDEPADAITASKYGAMHGEFMDALQKEESVMNLRRVGLPSSFQLSAILRRGLETGALWYTFALSHPLALRSIFENHILPRFKGAQNTEEAKKSAMSYFSSDTDKLLARKMEQRREYNALLAKVFQE